MSTRTSPRPFSTKKFLLAAAVASAAISSSHISLRSANAETKIWTGAADATFTTAGNWSNGVPAASLVTDKALFNLPDYTTNPPFAPNLTATRAINGIIIGDGITATGTLAITGSQLQLGDGGILKDANSGAASITSVRIDKNQTFTNNSNTDLTLTTLARTGGATVNVVYGSGATGLIRTGTINGASGIIGPWATFTDTAGVVYYARNVTNVAGGQIGAYTAGTPVANADDLDLITVNYDLTLGAPSILTASAAANTIRYLGNAQTIQIGDVAATAFDLTTNGILNAGTGTLTITNGAGNTGGVVIGSGNELVLNAATADIDVAARIAAATASATSISLAGPNKVYLSNVTNLGTGTLTVNNNGNAAYIGGSTNALSINAVAGNIAFTTPIISNSSSPTSLVINPTGAFTITTPTITNLGTGTLTINNGLGFAAAAQTLTATNGSINAGIVTSNTGGANSLTIVGSGANQVIIDSITNNGAGAFTVTGALTIGPSGTLSVNGAAGNVVFSTAILSNSASATTLNLSRTGAALVNPSVNNMGTGTLTINGVVAGGQTLTATNGNIDAGTITGNSVATITGAGAQKVIASQVTNNFAGIMTLAGAWSVGSGGLAITPSNSSGQITVSAVIADGPSGPGTVTYNGPGVVLIATTPTYTGGTIINAGAVLSITGNSQSKTPFGPTNSTVTINGGQIYSGATTGAAITTTYNYIANGSFTVGRAGGSANATVSFPGTLTLNNDITITVGSGGTNGAPNSHTFGGVSDDGNGRSLTVLSMTNGQTPGLVFNGSNTFTGPFNIGNGVTEGRVNSGNTNASWNSTINLSSTGLLTMSSATALGAGTLTINGGVLTGNTTTTTNTTVIIRDNFTMGSGSVSNNTVKIGAGKVILSPTTGDTITVTVNTNQGAGLVNISDGGNGYGLTIQRNPGIAGGFALDGPNTFTGPLTILSGSASAPNVIGMHSLNRSNVLVINTGAVFGFTSSPMIIAGFQDGPGGGGTSTSNTSGRDTTVAGSGNYTFTGSMNITQVGATGANVFGLIKGGTGTQNLSGTSVYTRNTGVNGGVLNLDFSGPVATAPQNPGQDILYHNVAPNATPVVAGSFSMNGGTLRLSGLAGATNLQRAATIGIGVGGSNIVFNPAASNTVALLTGNMTRQSAGTLNVVLSGTSVAPTLDASGQLTNAANGLASTAANVNGIIGGHVTVNGADWAQTSGTHTASSALVALAGTDGTITVSVPDSSLITVGQNVVGAGVPNLTTVASIVDATHITLSQATTQTAFNNLSFFSTSALGTFDSTDGNATFWGSVPNGTPISFNALAGGLPTGLTAGRVYYVIGSDNATKFAVTAVPGGTTPILNGTGLKGTASYDTLSSVTAFTGYSAFAGDGSAPVTANASLAGTSTLTAASTFNSLKVSTTGPGESLDLGGQQLKVTTTNGGLLFTGADDYTISGASGSITADSDTVTGVGIAAVVIPVTQTQGLIVQQYGAGTLTISAPIVNGRGTLFNQNDGTTTTPLGWSSLTKSGPGTLVLSGANTYSGTTHLNGGITQVNSLIGAATSLGASTRDTSSADTTQVPTAIVFNGGTLQYAAGYSADSGDITTRSVTFNSNGAIIDTNGNNITWSAGPFGNSTVTALGGLTKTGAGKLTIASVGAYNGATVLKEGVLSVGSAAPIPQTVLNITRIASNVYTIADLGVAGTSGFFVGQTVMGQHLFPGTVITAINPGVSITLSQASISSSGVLANVTFGGFQGINDGGPFTSSSIGLSNEAPDNLVFDGGALEDTAAASHSTNRRFTVTPNGGTILASSTANGALTFSNTAAIVASGTGARTLTLGGTSTGTNAMGLKLVDGAIVGDTLAIAKSGGGTWALTNANTYTGGTTVSSGILLVKNTTGSATGANNVMMDGGTLGGSGSVAGIVFPGAGAHTIASSATLAANVKTTLTLNGLTTGANTTMAFNLVTPDIASGSDRIKVTGPNALNLGGGNIAITGINGGGEPSLGWYNIIEHNGFTGSISGITLPAVANNVAYQLDAVSNPNMIRLHRGFMGDANDDGTVNFTDFIILTQNFGQPGDWNDANFLGTATVDFSNFIVITQHFGQTIGGGDLSVSADEIALFQAASASFLAGHGIPEPTSLALLGVGAAALLTRRRKA